MQGGSGEQGKLNMNSDFERHIPGGDPFVLFCFINQNRTTAFGWLTRNMYRYLEKQIRYKFIGWI